MAVYASWRTTSIHNDIVVNKSKPFAFRNHGQPKGFALQSGRHSADQSQYDLKFDEASKQWINPNVAKKH